MNNAELAKKAWMMYEVMCQLYEQGYVTEEAKTTMFEIYCSFI